MIENEIFKTLSDSCERSGDVRLRRGHIFRDGFPRVILIAAGGEQSGHGDKNEVRIELLVCATLTFAWKVFESGDLP